MANGESESFPRLMSVVQAAAALGVSAQTVRAMVKDGRLPAIRVSQNSTRVKESDVLSILKGGAK